MGKQSAAAMNTTAKKIRVIPYGRLIDRIHAFTPDATMHRVRISKTWGRIQDAHELWRLLIAFSDELDEGFARTFRERATQDTKLLVLNDSRSSDTLLSRMVDLQIRSPHRFYVVDPPFAQTNEQNWDNMIRSFLGRLTAALDSNENDGRIFDAHVEDQVLHVVSADFRRLAVPISKILGLAEASEARTRRFQIDDDGSYIYWPDFDLHLGWEQLQQIVDPEAAQKAMQKSREFNLRYGGAIRKIREARGLAITAIPELSDKQLRRIERGECRLTSSAGKKLAGAHGMSPNEYLQTVAAALK
jgi:Protein of unknown function (DUF2442)